MQRAALRQGRGWTGKGGEGLCSRLCSTIFKLLEVVEVMAPVPGSGSEIVVYVAEVKPGSQSWGSLRHAKGNGRL